MAGTRSKKSSPAQQSFDWTLQPAPAMKDRGNFTQTPKEVLRQFMAACDSMAAARLVAYIVDETYGGQFDPRVYGDRGQRGERAEELRKRGERPNCIPLTIARIAEICCVSESGALKVKPYLEKELAILKTDNLHGQEWYWLDYEQMRGLKAITPRTVTPKAATTNIPTDIRPVGMPMVRVPDSDVEIPLAAACPSGDSCCLVAKYAGPSPCGGNSHLVDTITPAFAKHTLEGRNGDHSGAAANGNGAPSNGHKPTLEGRFSPQTLVLKPGADAQTITLGGDIEAVRVRNTHGDVVSMSGSLTGRILELTLSGELPIDNAAILDSASGTNGAAGKLTLDEVTRRLNNRLRDRLATRAPASVTNGVFQLIQTERAWQLLETKISNDWKRITSWKLLPLFAKDAADAYADELADSTPQRPVAARESLADQCKRLAATLAGSEREEYESMWPEFFPQAAAREGRHVS